MRLGSIASVYILFWTLSLFLVLPWGVRTSEEEGTTPEPGHDARCSTSSHRCVWPAWRGRSRRLAPRAAQ